MEVDYVATVTPFGGVGSDCVEQIDTNLTGSCFLVSFEYSDGTTKYALVDCGIHQGTKNNESLNNFFPFDIDDLSAVILTHAHVDHCGRIPWLYKNGYRGHVYASTLETKLLSEIQWADCANINQREYDDKLREFKRLKNTCAQAGRLLKAREKSVSGNGGNRVEKPSVQETNEAVAAREKILKQYKVTNIDDIAPEPPFYVLADVEVATLYTKVLPKKDGKNSGSIPELPCVSFQTFYAGHILGGCSIVLSFLSKGGRQKRILFSADLGTYERGFSPHGDPQTDPKLRVDLAFLETTYGGVVREENYYKNGLEQFISGVQEELRKGKTLIIPVFSMDRSEEVLYHLKDISGVNIYFDSKTGMQIISLYEDRVPMYNGTLKYIPLDSETREKFFTDTSKKIVVTSSGMCEGGPVVVYLEKYLNDPNITIMLTGYMSPSTLGGKLREGQKRVEIKTSTGKKIVEVKAKILFYSFMSGHGDESTLLRWIDGWKWSQHGKIYLNHGSKDGTTLAFKHTIERKQLNGELNSKVKPFVLSLNQAISV